MTDKRDFELTDEQKELAAKLTKLQLGVALQYVRGGMSQREAYVAAGGKAKTENTQKSSASEILTNPDVMAFITSLNESAVKSSVMSREEAMNILSSMARTTIRDVAKFRKVEVGADDNGEPVHQSVWELKDEDEIDGEAIGSISELSEVTPLQ
jgi:phage terminase small subunit